MHPEYRAVTPPAEQAATQGQAQALDTGWPWPLIYHVAQISTKQKGDGTHRTSAVLAGLR